MYNGRLYVEIRCTGALLRLVVPLVVCLLGAAERWPEGAGQPICPSFKALTFLMRPDSRGC
jgi:hypothetical protein